MQMCAYSLIISDMCYRKLLSWYYIATKVLGSDQVKAFLAVYC